MPKRTNGPGIADGAVSPEIDGPATRANDAASGHVRWVGRPLMICLTYYALLIGAWTATWTVSQTIGLVSWSSGVQTLYWTLAKLLIWLAPIFIILTPRRTMSIGTYLSIERFAHGARVGALYGLAFVLLSFLSDVRTKSFGAPTVDPGLLNALLIAPLFEELVFRGFLLTTLQEAEVPFWTSNVVAALMFLGLHIPGWYFTGSPKTSDTAALVGITLVGLVAGVAMRRSGSLWGAIVFHVANNLYGSFVR